MNKAAWREGFCLVFVLKCHSMALGECYPIAQNVFPYWFGYSWEYEAKGKLCCFLNSQYILKCKIKYCIFRYYYFLGWENQMLKSKSIFAPRGAAWALMNSDLFLRGATDRLYSRQMGSSSNLHKSAAGGKEGVRSGCKNGCK